jgi:hypothetical protein
MKKKRNLLSEQHSMNRISVINFLRSLLRPTCRVSERRYWGIDIRCSDKSAVGGFGQNCNFVHGVLGQQERIIL